jgi:hypothetical protein
LCVCVVVAAVVALVVVAVVGVHVCMRTVAVATSSMRWASRPLQPSCRTARLDLDEMKEKLKETEVKE